MSALERGLSGNTPWDFGLAACIAALVFLAGVVTRRLARARSQQLALTPEHELTELPLRVISQTKLLFVGIIAVASALSTLELSARARGPISSVLTVALFVQAGIWCTTAVVVWLERKRAQTLASDRGAVGSLGIIGFVVRASVWALVLLLALDNLGVDI